MERPESEAQSVPSDNAAAPTLDDVAALFVGLSADSRDELARVQGLLSRLTSNGSLSISASKQAAIAEC